ncbi:MAG: hypothetical protein ACRD96_05710 [Bryobacteraceae bacterium]
MTWHGCRLLRRRRLLRLLVLLLTGHLVAGDPHFQVAGEPEGSWPRLLSSIGLIREALDLSPSSSARLVVLRAGTAASPHWMERVEQGMTVILEGESPVAETFGFRGGAQRVRVSSVVDTRRPKLPIVWEKALELPRFEVPDGARVHAKERWTGAPLVASHKRGAGAVLWVAADPGAKGYERFPYLLQTLAELGVEPPARASRLWAFFDSSYRLRADPDYLAARWRQAGIAAIHVAAWHYNEPDAGRDAYLKNLIDACHRHGVLVYSWLELPHVSEKFWNDHPQWREKTAALQDAHLDWRKLINLTNRDAFRAVSREVRGLISRFDWDGVNLAELYFESLEGAANPSRFTPMNDDVRALFQKAQGFDPIELWSARKDPQSLRAFLDFRAELARLMQEDWLAEISAARRERPHLDIVLTHVDDRLDTGMRDAIGADAERVLPLLDKHDFTFLVEDPATVWHLGPERYPQIAKSYLPLTKRTERLAIDINVVDRYQDVYPTKQQTGAELFQLVRLASQSFGRVALYFESSILPPDLALLPAAAATVRSIERSGTRWIVDAARPVGLNWQGPALVDGRSWPVISGSVVWLPAGRHTVEHGGAATPLRIVDFNGELESAEVTADGVRLRYQSGSRAIAIVERRPAMVEIDGVPARAEALESGRNWAVLLPRGRHGVVMRGAPASPGAPR